MNTLFDIFLITIIVCFIVDVSGFINDGVKPFVAWFINRKSTVKVKPENINIGKPWSCSLCCVWWAGLGYIIITNQFSLVNLACVCLFALLSSNISSILLLLKDILSTIENVINKLLMKIYKNA